MSPWVMVTAYLARSCWISTRSSVRVMSEALTALHYKIDFSCNADIGQRVARYRDDVGETSLGDAAQVGPADQVRGGHRGGAQHRGGRQTPLDQGYQFLGVAAVRDRRSVGADVDLRAGLERGLDRRARPGEHLGGLGLQFRRRLGDVHVLGQPS